MSSGLSSRVYPEAKVMECLDTPHNRIDLSENDNLALHRRGKQTLVFGELKNAVRFSEEEGNACPNYWHFSPYGFCPYGCKYCYLAGTQGVKFSPTVKIYCAPILQRCLPRLTALPAGCRNQPLFTSASSRMPWPSIPSRLTLRIMIYPFLPTIPLPA